MSDPNHLSPERLARIRAVANAMELALEDDWVYVAFIGKANSPESVNVIANCPQSVSDKLLEEILRRKNSGFGPIEIPKE